MHSQIDNKAMLRWWVIKDWKTGLWAYSNRPPGPAERDTAEGPMAMAEAKERAHGKNKELQR